MKLVVVSDNHGMRQPLIDILNKHQDADAFFHCGDSEMSYEELESFVTVCGNNDYSMDFDIKKFVNLNGHRIFITHGHRYLYMGRIENLLREAKENKCNFVFFGHTHSFFYEVIDGIHILNPGSLSRNRDGTFPSYAVVEINGDQVSVKRFER